MRYVWLSLAVGLSFGVFSASCSGTPACDVRTCPNGCCGVGGRCVQTTTSQECGTRGEACKACSLGQSCSLGMCQGGFGTGAGMSGAGGGSGVGGGFGGGSVGGGTAGGGTAGGAVGGGVAGGSTSCTDGCLSGGLCRQAGTTQQNNNQCGNFGVTCMQCVPPNGTCSNGFCVPGGAGGGGGGVGGGAPGGGPAGGGAAGGGSAGGGGAGPACPALPISTLPGSGFNLLRADYVPSGAAFNEAYFATGTTVVGFELVRQMPLTIPFGGQITSASYSACVACVRYGEQCSISGEQATCAREFLAQSGSVLFTQASEASTGQFTGTVTNVLLRQWNFSSDTIVPNGACYTIPGASFTASWP